MRDKHIKQKTMTIWNEGKGLLLSTSTQNTAQNTSAHINVSNPTVACAVAVAVAWHDAWHCILHSALLWLCTVSPSRWLEGRQWVWSGMKKHMTEELSEWRHETPAHLPTISPITNHHYIIEYPRLLHQKLEKNVLGIP